MKDNKKKKKKRLVSSFEGSLIKFGILIIIVLIVGLVFSETTLARVNVDVQKQEKVVKEQKKQIESLKMKMDEMTSLDRIKEISIEYGLSYISENIKTIE